MIGNRPLPHQAGRLFLTDGGIETWLMYKQGFDLPHFCTFHLLDDPRGRDALRRYYLEFAGLAKQRATGYIFCSLTYRASRDWGGLLGLTRESIDDYNQRAIAFYREIAEEAGLDAADVLYSGCIGPRGDAYETRPTITAESAEEYHADQVASFKAAGADLVTALTLNSVEEAVGIARAASSAGVPCVISFTLEQGGLVGGREMLRSAIEQVDVATGHAPAYYMINCSHPVDFLPALEDGDWKRRLGGFRANASSLEHGQLCQLGRLDEGDAPDLARWHADLARALRHVNVYGGCCGTDFVHVAGICDAVRRVREDS